VNRDTPVAAQPPAGMSLLKRPEESKTEPQLSEPVGNEILATGDTTKRHRNTTHNRSGSVATTIAEEAEEDEDFSSKPGLGRAPTVKKEGGLSRSDTIKPEPEPEAAEAPGSIIVEEPSSEDSKPTTDVKPESEGAEDEEAEITVIEAEVPEDSEGPGESAAEIPEQPVKAETIVDV
jgi:hypothetical protein